MLPGSLCLSAAGLRFSGRPVPAEDIGVPCGRLPTERTSTGFPRFALVRCDRVGRSLYSGVVVSVSMAEMNHAP